MNGPFQSVEDCVGKLAQRHDLERAAPSFGVHATRGPAENPDLANLDLLRSVAVVLVFADHLAPAMGLRGLGELGYLGVLFFFVHTALVLMFSMERMRLTGRGLYARFMVRRVFRIYPLSVIAVLAVVSLRIPSVAWMKQFVWAGWPDLVSNLLLTQNITRSVSVDCVLWSLPFEIQMYAILPLLFLLIRRYPPRQTIIALWLAMVVIAGAEYMLRGSNFQIEFLLFRYLPCFFAGVAAWQLFKTRRRSVPSILWPLFLLCLIVLFRLEGVWRVYGPAWWSALHGTLRNDFRMWAPRYHDLVRDWTFCAVTGLTLPFFADVANRRVKWICRTIARYSYGIYICHVPILWLFCTRLHLGAVAGAALSLAATAVVSFVLYHSIEHPAIQFGKRLTAPRLSGIAAGVSAMS